MKHLFSAESIGGMLAKTPLGRDALLDRMSGLTPKQRQILILSNGKRSAKQLAQMMGNEVLPHIEYLLEIGLLMESLDGGASNPEFQNSSLDSFIDVSHDF